MFGPTWKRTIRPFQLILNCLQPLYFWRWRRPIARRPRRIFPTSLTGDVTSEIAEDFWERGWCLYNKPGLNTVFPLPPSWQVYLVAQSHAFVSVYVLGGVVQRQEFVPLLERIQNGVLPLWSVRVFWFQTWSERTFVDPKRERKYATEYSTAEKWASKS